VDKVCVNEDTFVADTGHYTEAELLCPSVATIKKGFYKDSIKLYIIKGIFSFVRICSRGIVPHAYNVTLRMIRSFEFQFSTGCVTVLTIVSTIRCVRPARL
jgi:hypothetical protein